jgi:hypothetical protein
MSTVSSLPSSPGTATPLRLTPVSGRRALTHFIRLPWAIYANDPAWVPPLRLERRQHLAPSNPYFAHARWQGWLAWRGDRPVGRISAQVDRLHLEQHQDATGFFGLLEAVDDAAVFQALFDTAEGWVRVQGLRRVMGPFNLSINDESGLLVEGFETPPALLMGHARPYYGGRVEEQGYQPVKDLLAYRLRADFPVPAAMQVLTRKVGDRIVLRPLRRARLAEDLGLMREIFNDAWSHNWNFVPFTEAEFARIGRDLTRLIDPDFIQIAEVDGVAAAMIVLLPNLNELLADLDGRLLPFGWLKLLWRLRYAYPRSARVPLMGVKRCYHNTLLGTALTWLVIAALRPPAQRRGIQEVELSWILEDNFKIRNVIESLGGTVYKRYRVYQKALG